MISLANLWNVTEQNATHYEKLFQSNPHELAAMIGQSTNYTHWQEFLGDSRVQDYIDKMNYIQAGITVNTLMQQTGLSQAQSAKLRAAIQYRDDHKPDFAVPVQYIYISTPLTPAEDAFLPDVPENNKVGI